MKFQEFRLLPQLTIVELLFVLSLIFPVSSLARSGCCSGHDGVNCAAGAQSNGNVICNDGWRGSSCSYSGMVMCGGGSITTTTLSTSTPRLTFVKTIAPTVKPIIVPTESPTPSISPTPEVLGVSATNNPTPNSTPARGTGSVFGGFVIFAAMLAVPFIVIRKIVRNMKNKNSSSDNSNTENPPDQKLDEG